MKKDGSSALGLQAFFMAISQLSVDELNSSMFVQTVVYFEDGGGDDDDDDDMGFAQPVAVPLQKTSLISSWEDIDTFTHTHAFVYKGRC
ncbi:hypothetical protein E2320_013137 [Naja naja]|nr:hypothetical protein E2320_013137 [Naja naja]